MSTVVRVRIVGKTFKFRGVKEYSILHDLNTGMSTYKFNTRRGQKVLKVPTSVICWFRED